MILVFRGKPRGGKGMAPGVQQGDRSMGEIKRFLRAGLVTEPEVPLAVAVGENVRVRSHRRPAGLAGGEGDPGGDGGFQGNQPGHLDIDLIAVGWGGFDVGSREHLLPGKGDGQVKGHAVAVVVESGGLPRRQI